MLVCNRTLVLLCLMSMCFVCQLFVCYETYMFVQDWKASIYVTSGTFFWFSCGRWFRSTRKESYLCCCLLSFDGRFFQKRIHCHGFCVCAADLFLQKRTSMFRCSTFHTTKTFMWMSSLLWHQPAGNVQVDAHHIQCFTTGTIVHHCTISCFIFKNPYWILHIFHINQHELIHSRSTLQLSGPSFTNGPL